MILGEKELVNSEKEKENKTKNNIQTSDQQENQNLRSETSKDKDSGSGFSLGSSSDNENSESESEKAFDPDSNRKKKRKIVPYTEQQIKRQLKLLKYSELYLYFLRPQDHPELQVELDKLNLKSQTTDKRIGRHRDPNRKEIVNNFDDEPEGKVMHFETTPPFVDGQYKMRDYQIDGLNWLIRMYADGMNGILADEMGLGKTFQVISLLSYLHMYENIKGPHLVVCPKSVCRNWAEEFDKWVPGMFKVKVLEGEKETRKEFIKQLKDNPNNYDVIISSPELAVVEYSFLRKIHYVYTILDEAHRIKNVKAKFTMKLKGLTFDHSLLITGTPLQNNLDELWSLLNFISRDVFSDHEDFQYWLTNQPNEDNAIEKLKMIISPFILRRIKIEVEKSLLPKKVRQIYTGLSTVQKKLYKDLLSNDIQLINDHRNAKNSASSLANLLIQLRKCVNHPYLFRHIEPQPYIEGEHLVDVCGKLSVLDKLLKHWKENGDRVLIFSQMIGFLDIFEDYCIMRGFKYCRIDGSTEHELRVSQIKEYNKPDSDKFLFLLSTKAAGQGINLATANIVVIYDLDWNPQVDLQAMDRAHRIGQKKQVFVYQLITEDSIEEKVLEKATKKLKLDQMVIQKKLVNTAASKVNASEMITTIRHGAKEILKGEGKSSIRNEPIQEILAKSESRSQKFEQEMASVGYNELVTLSDRSINLNDERNRHNISLQNTQHYFLAPDSRQRNRKEVNYSELPKPKVEPTDYSKYDYRFYPQELYTFYERENDYYLKCYPELIPINILPGSPERIRIMQARPLTNEEEIKKQQLIKQGFNNWSRKDYQLIIRTAKDPFFYDFEYLFDKFKDSKGNLTKPKEDITKYVSHLIENCEKLADSANVKTIFKDWIDRVNHVNQNLTILKKLKNEFTKSNFKNPFNLIQQPLKYSRFSQEQQLSLCLISYEIGLKSPDLYSKLQHVLIDHPDFLGCWSICSLNADNLKKNLTGFLTALAEYKFIEEPTFEKAQNTYSRKPAPQSCFNNTKNSISLLQSVPGNAHKIADNISIRSQQSTAESVSVSGRIENIQALDNSEYHNPKPVKFSMQSTIVPENYPIKDRHTVNHSRHNSSAHSQQAQLLQAMKQIYPNSNPENSDTVKYSQQQINQSQYPKFSVSNTPYSTSQAQGINHNITNPSYSYIQPITQQSVSYHAVSSQNHQILANQTLPQTRVHHQYTKRRHKAIYYPMNNGHIIQQTPQVLKAIRKKAVQEMMLQNLGIPPQHTAAVHGYPYQIRPRMISPNHQAAYQHIHTSSPISNTIGRPAHKTQPVFPQNILNNQQIAVAIQQVPQQIRHANTRYSKPPQTIGSYNSFRNQNIQSAPLTTRYNKGRPNASYINLEYQAIESQFPTVNTTLESSASIQSSDIDQDSTSYPLPITVPQGFYINLKTSNHTTPPISGNAQSEGSTPTRSDFIQSFSPPGHHSITSGLVVEQSPNPGNNPAINTLKSDTPQNL